MNIFLISFLEEINPLGLLHISTYLKKNGYNVATLFVPLNQKEKEFGVEENRPIEENEIGKIIDFISRKNPDIIGMSLMTIHYHTAAKVTGKVKETFPDIPVIWGGIHPTLCPEECMQHADMVCRGEGESAMLELVQRLEDGGPVNDIQSIWIRTDDGVIRNEVRPLVQDLDSLEFPVFDWENNYVLYRERVQLLSKELYRSCVPRNGHIYDVMATRGCPYHCSYCCNASFKKLYTGKGKLLRSRSIENLIRELEYVKDTFDFVKIINFQDDVFLTRNNDGWLQEFCKVYPEKIGLPFVCKGSPREVNEQTICMLKDAGMEYFHIGIQNSDRVNREIYRRTTSDHSQVIRASGILNRHAIVPRYDVILDDPFATEEDQLEVLDTLTRIKKPFLVSCFSMTFFPGSEISKMAEEKGLLENGKNGYMLKTTFAKRSYLNNLVEISPRVPRFVINFFVKRRNKLFAKELLKVYIFFHYNYVMKALYTISKYPKILSLGKNIRFYFRAERQRVTKNQKGELA